MRVNFLFSYYIVVHVLFVNQSMNESPAIEKFYHVNKMTPCTFAINVCFYMVCMCVYNLLTLFD